MLDTPEARLTTLYERHYEEVLAFCVRRGGRDAADDVTAEVFAVAWRRIDDVELETARAWLYGVARRLLANRWRATMRRRLLLGKLVGSAPQLPPKPDEQVVRRSIDREVVSAVRALRPVDQEVLLLAAWEELTAPEIARVMGISTSAAEQRLHRAKRRLARRLQVGSLESGLAPRAAEEGGRT